VLPKKHAAEAKGIKSTHHKVETTIKFVNRSRQTIKVYWLDYEGNRQFRATVKEGDSYESKRTYLTHPWLITDTEDNAWSIYFPDAQPRTVEILGPGSSVPEPRKQTHFQSNLASSLVRREESIPTAGPWGEWCRYFRGDTHGTRDMVVLAVLLKPGQAPHPPHQHAEEEFMILAEGTGSWTLDGKEMPARKGDVVYAAPWTMHGLKNTGAAPLTYYMVKWNNKGVPAPERPPQEKGPKKQATLPSGKPLNHEGGVRPGARGGPDDDGPAFSGVSSEALVCSVVAATRLAFCDPPQAQGRLAGPR
jgi:mannose-6-phosphate isomerase-like protein (cupin superfamily)